MSKDKGSGSSDKGKGRMSVAGLEKLANHYVKQAEKAESAGELERAREFFSKAGHFYHSASNLSAKQSGVKESPSSMEFMYRDGDTHHPTPHGALLESAYSSWGMSDRVEGRIKLGEHYDNPSRRDNPFYSRGRRMVLFLFGSFLSLFISLKFFYNLSITGNVIGSTLFSVSNLFGAAFLLTAVLCAIFAFSSNFKD